MFGHVVLNFKHGENRQQSDRWRCNFVIHDMLPWIHGINKIRKLTKGQIEFTFVPVA